MWFNMVRVFQWANHRVPYRNSMAEAVFVCSDKTWQTIMDFNLACLSPVE